MGLDEIKWLRDIIEISNEVVEKLGGRRHFEEAKFELCRATTSHTLTMESDTCDTSFRNLQVSVNLAANLASLFEQKSFQLREHYERKMGNFNVIFLKLGGEEKHLSKFSKVVQSRLNKARKEIYDDIVQAVEAEIRRFHRDAASSDMESASESDTVHKGHSRFAVAILEKVFSQTMNITRAEKFQLAKATKLEPRQVTIWFQNRRNRKNIVSQSDVSLNNQTRAQASTATNKKRKYDGMEEEPRTPTQRRRLSQNEIMSSSGSTVFTYDTPLSATSSVSINSDLFESKLSSSNNRSISGSSTTTSYDDGSCFFQGSTFGNTSFDDNVQKLASSDGFDYSNEDKLMFNKEGQLQLDIEDLQLDLSAFGEELSQSKFDQIDFSLTTPSAMETNEPKTPQFKVSQEELSDEEALMQFARQLVERQIHADEEMRRISEQESWSTGTLDKIFFGNDITNTNSSEAEEMGLSDICSSQASSQNGTSQVNTPKNVFDFTVEGLGLDKIAEQNYESITENKDPMDMFTPFSQMTFDFASPKMLCAPYNPTKASSQ